MERILLYGGERVQVASWTSHKALGGVHSASMSRAVQWRPSMLIRGIGVGVVKQQEAKHVSLTTSSSYMQCSLSLQGCNVNLNAIALQQSLRHVCSYLGGNARTVLQRKGMKESHTAG
ncbi:unnamed protein product [Aphanomyces euteiches]